MKTADSVFQVFILHTLAEMYVKHLHNQNGIVNTIEQKK